MISSNDLKPGLTILVDGEIYTVLEASQNKTARSAMVVKAKVRNVRTGSNVELSWGGGEKVEPAQIEKREMQYLYDTDEAMVFMDNETYDQVEIPMDRLKWERNFIVLSKFIARNYQEYLERKGQTEHGECCNEIYACYS